MTHWITAERAEIVTAWATVAGVAVALVAALVALRQLRMIRRDSHDRTRPYVQLDVVPGLHGPGSWDLILENKGASTALAVVVDVGEIEPHDAEDHIAHNVGKYLLAPKTLVPGARRRIMWGFRQVDKNGNETARAGVLDPREITVSYLDERKARWWWRRCRPYKTAFTVGDAFMLPVFPAPSEGPVPSGDDMLKHIDRALRTLNTHVGELRR